MICITKRLIGNRGLVISPGWVSNGHWLVDRRCVSNSAVFHDCATAAVALSLRDRGPGTDREDDDHATIITTPLLHHLSDAVRFNPTGWYRKDGARSSAVYRSDRTKGSALILLDKDYAETLEDLGTFLMVPQCSDRVFIVRGEDVVVVLMPMQGGAPGKEWTMGTWLDFSSRAADQRRELLAKVEGTPQ